MTIYHVVIVPHMGVRWIDSSWVTQQDADARLERIMDAWDVAGNTPTHHKGFVCRAELENSTLDPPAGESEPGEPG